MKLIGFSGAVGLLAMLTAAGVACSAGPLEDKQSSQSMMAWAYEGQVITSFPPVVCLDDTSEYTRLQAWNSATFKGTDPDFNILVKIVYTDGQGKPQQKDHYSGAMKALWAKPIVLEPKARLTQVAYYVHSDDVVANNDQSFNAARPHQVKVGVDTNQSVSRSRDCVAAEVAVATSNPNSCAFPDGTTFCGQSGVDSNIVYECFGGTWRQTNDCVAEGGVCSGRSGGFFVDRVGTGGDACKPNAAAPAVAAPPPKTPVTVPSTGTTVSARSCGDLTGSYNAKNGTNLSGLCERNDKGASDPAHDRCGGNGVATTGDDCAHCCYTKDFITVIPAKITD